MVLCVGLNSTDTPCSPGPGSTLKVPLGNGTAMLRPEAENTRADLADGPPVWQRREARPQQKSIAISITSSARLMRGSRTAATRISREGKIRRGDKFGHVLGQ